MIICFGLDRLTHSDKSHNYGHATVELNSNVPVNLMVKALLWLRLLDASLSSQRPGFDSRPVHVGLW
jgi:hypothetical protein